MEDFVLIAVQCKPSRLLHGILGDELREENVTWRGEGKQGGGKWRGGEEELVLENNFFLFKDIYTISTPTGGMEIVSKQRKGVLQGMRK